MNLQLSSVTSDSDHYPMTTKAGFTCMESYEGKGDEREAKNYKFTHVVSFSFSTLLLSFCPGKHNLRLCFILIYFGGPVSKVLFDF